MFIKMPLVDNLDFLAFLNTMILFFVFLISNMFFKEINTTTTATKYHVKYRCMHKEVEVLQIFMPNISEITGL